MYVLTKRTVWGIIAAVLLAAVVISAACFFSADLAEPTLAEAIFQGKTTEKAVALAINVDWGEDVLPELLAVLARENVQVTFFVTGRFAEKNPDLVQEMAAGGHEIGNHGYSHPHPDKLSPEKNQEEIEKTEQILQALGVETAPLFAPPYGEFGTNCLQGADNCQYQTIMWSRDTIDWQEPPPSRETLVQRITGKPLESGMIMLMHPKKHTLEALPEIINAIREQGFTCLKVSEVL